ncbi:MAG: hypothetical protein ACHQLQ_04895 [Candidatus Acidiferrales bacterium]
MNIVRPRGKEYLLLAGLTIAAIIVNGYHPAIEDAEIYTPGILKVLHPSLFPYNVEFFESHARMTFFPQLIAGSMRVTRLPLSAAFLTWHFFSIFLLLLGCWRIASLCFEEKHAAWCGVALVGSLLSIPVAGTRLFLMDPYFTTRSLSAPGALLGVAGALEEKYLAAATWILFTAAIHPLMAVFAAVYVGIILLLKFRTKSSGAAASVAALPQQLFPPATSEYREILQTRPYFFLSNWAWYEWLGLLAPFALLAWFARVGRRYALGPMNLACRALVLYGSLFFATALIVSRPGRFENLAEIQPLRYLHLLYILMFLFIGGLLGKFVLQRQTWRWAALFVPLCAGMAYAQQETSPATAHLELPGRASGNPWVQAFEWIRVNTPEDAYFALNPKHMALPGEDQHGFRAIAQRSMLADAVKDSGAASMFPALAGKWKEQAKAQEGWGKFQYQDFLRLNQRYGVDWVVVERPGAAGLVCPYANELLLVCRIE